MESARSAVFDQAENRLQRLVAAFEDHHAWNSRDGILGGQIVVFIDVDLADFHLAGILGSDLIDRRSHHPAWAAPLSPEVNQNRLRGIQNFLIESRIRKNQCIGTRHILSPMF